MTYFDVFSKSTAKCKHCDMGIIRRKLTKTDEVINKCKLKKITFYLNHMNISHNLLKI